MTASILIADDEPNIVLSLEFVLQEEGYRVRVARDGQEALDALAAELPDLLLLDVMLPRVSGFEVCERIRTNARWRGLRVVMLSAKGREVEVQKGLALGADAYVTKPFAIKELLAEVARQLGRSRA
ncbi:MAG: response regulator [Burkholderiales bacterium]|nr:response regulator [Burkholderiales bacterium]